MSQNRVIGLDNDLPWHLPADLRHFKAATLGKPVIMGRKTFDSIKKPLPNRLNIVVTRKPFYKIKGAEVVSSFSSALERAAEHCATHELDEVMCLGGAQLYARALPQADKLYRTLVDVELEGDTFFPEYDESDWRLVAEQAFSMDEKNQYSFTISQWLRK